MSARIILCVDSASCVQPAIVGIDGEQLDVVIMNREAYDLLSAWGYLLDLGDACAANPRLEAALVSNTVISSDNRVEVELNEADAYIAETIEIANAVELGDSPLFPDFAADEHIYLGVIANTPRQEQSLDYLDYVLGLQ